MKIKSQKRIKAMKIEERYAYLDEVAEALNQVEADLAKGYSKAKNRRLNTRYRQLATERASVLRLDPWWLRAIRALGLCSPDAMTTKRFAALAGRRSVGQRPHKAH